MCPTPTLWLLWLLLILHFYKQVHEEHLCHALMVLAQSSLTTNSQQRNYWVKICAHFKAIVAGGGTQGLRCSTAELHPHINREWLSAASNPCHICLGPFAHAKAVAWPLVGFILKCSAPKCSSCVSVCLLAPDFSLVYSGVGYGSWKACSFFSTSWTPSQSPTVGTLPSAFALCLWCSAAQHS